MMVSSLDGNVNDSGGSIHNKNEKINISMSENVSVDSTTTTTTTTPSSCISNDDNNNNNNDNIPRFVQNLKLKKGWEKYDEDLERFVRECPKVELHVHLDGSFDSDFLWNAIQKKPELINRFPASVNPPWEPSKILNLR